MKILVTGANGLLGQKLVALLSGKSEVTVHATSRGPGRMPTLPAGTTYHSLDLTDEKGVQALVTTLQPDCIIHTAGQTMVDACEQDHEACVQHNIESTRHLMSAANPAHCHFIYLSTDFIFSGEDGPYREEDEPAPVNFYGECKLKAEELVRNYGGKWAIVRTVLVYGLVHEMSRSNIVLWVKKSLEEGKEIKVVTDQLRTPTLAEDLAEGCALVALQQAEGVYHISGEEALTPYEVAIRTARFFGLTEELIKKADSSTFTQPARRPPRTGFDISKAQHTLGYSPRTLEEGLAILKEQLQA